VHEVSVDITDLIYPMFITAGETEEIPSMPGIYRYSVADFPNAIKTVYESGVRAVLYFGIPDHKDELGSCAYDDNGVVQKAIRITKELYPDMIVIADICLCEYTSHGHCGFIEDGYVNNDKTLVLLNKAAVPAQRQALI
jgi:porphobilinogen synthase